MSIDDERLSLEELRGELRGSLSNALGIESSQYRVEYLCEPKDVADDPAKLLVKDLRGRKLAVVLVASPVEPELVGRGMRIAGEAKHVLGESLGCVILTPLGEGTIRGLSYTILPFQRPISEGMIARRYWRLVLRPKVLDWVAGISERTATRVDDVDVQSTFEVPLEHLAALETMHPEIRSAARNSLLQLKGSEWEPYSVLMHGDLWEDNLLLASPSPWFSTDRRNPPFVVIDWPGATLRGYPMYDLLRITHSMRLGNSALRREISRHCEIFGVGAAGAVGHLLACLGHIGLNLGCFPMEMYTAMSMTCFNDMRKALAIPDG